AARRAPPDSAPRSGETSRSAADRECGPRPADRSSACVLPRRESWPHRPSATRTPTPPANARTRDNVRKPPSPPPPPLHRPARGRRPPPLPGGPAVFLLSLPFVCQRSQSAETQDENHTL